MKNLTRLTFLILGLFLMSSCTKEEEKVSIASKTAILSENTWKIAAVSSHQTIDYNFSGFNYSIDTTFDVLKGHAECEYDVSYNFVSDGQLKYTLAETYCGEDITSDFSWKLDDEASVITFYGEEGVTFITTPSGTMVDTEAEFKVLELESDIFKIRYSLPYEEFVAGYFGDDIFQMYEEMGVDMTGSADVDYTFVKQ